MKNNIFTVLLAFHFMFAFTAHAQTAPYAASYIEVTGKIKNDGRDVPFTALIPNGRGTFPLVVMNHGHGGSREEHGGFKRLAEAISAKGIATVRMDFPGCGESNAPFTQNTMTNMISDSNACLDYMLKNYPINKNRLGIFGYSLGGRIAMSVVNQKRQPYKAMALLAPALLQGDNLINVLTGGAAKARALEEEAKEKGSALFSGYGQNLELSREWFENLRNSRPLDNVTFRGPALIALGTNDKIITFAECDAAHAALAKAGSNVTRKMIFNAGHGYGFSENQSDVSNSVESCIAGFFAENL